MLLCLAMPIVSLDKSREGTIAVAQESTVNEEKINALVKRFYTSATDAEIEATGKEYQQLNAQELDRFYELRKRYDLDQVKTQLSSARVSPEQYETLKARVELAGDGRKEINRLSQEKYGLPINRISGSQLEQLFAQMKSDSKFQRLNSLSEDPSARVDDARAKKCTPVNLTLTAKTTGSSGVKWFTYYKVTQQNQTDCDWIYAFPGTRTLMHAENTDAWLLLQSLGNQTRMRHTGATDILIGANRLWFFVLYPADLRLTMR